MASPVDPGGFENEFVPPLHDDFMCAICHLAMRDPVLTICGHRFCRSCLTEYHRRSRRVCPMDNQELAVEEIFPDNATKRSILSSSVKCPNTGCDWIKELSQLESHRNECQFEEVACTTGECSARVIRSGLSNHVAFTCQWRDYECVHCKERFPFCKKESHESTCRLFPVKCPNGCNDTETIARENLTEHLNKFCPLALVDCQYVDIGCTEKVKRRELEKHLESSTHTHLELACGKISELGDKVDNQNQEIKKVETQNWKQNLQLQEQGKKLKKQGEELEEVRAQQNQTPFVWKITNFQRILQSAKDGENTTTQSDPFWTSPLGYKLKVRVHPNGFGRGKGTHISVLIVIMKGKFDAILPWPFAKKITFTVFDQQENMAERKNITRTIANFATVPSRCRQRPTSDENTSYGFPAFASHEELKLRKFISDDTLFLQVDVTDDE